MYYCNGNFMRFYELAGIVLLIFKCFVPLLIIVFGTFDLLGLVIKSKEKDNKIKRFIIRIIAGIIIFFMPTIILTIFDRVGLNKAEYLCIYNCVLDIKKCEYIEKEESIVE